MQLGRIKIEQNMVSCMNILGYPQRATHRGIAVFLGLVLLQSDSHDPRLLWARSCCHCEPCAGRSDSNTHTALELLESVLQLTPQPCNCAQRTLCGAPRALKFKVEIDANDTR